MDTPAPHQASARPGHLLEGRYRVGAMIARGGMSTVYRGVDQRLDRPVAIKIMDPAHATDPAFLGRFEREARLAAGVHHRGVVQVFDQGREGELVYLVMELVDGGTLRELLRERGPLPVPVVIGILEPLLAALGAAHDAGLVHRDVKPENVLINSRGEVKVADFGLVRAVSSATFATGDVILGTVAYLSPEQVSTGASDPRSDVYAAGIVAWEMLTGHPPYSGDNPIGVAYQHVHSDVPPVGEINADVPVELEDLLLAATRREPDARPRDAGQFLSALRSVRAHLGIELPRLPVPAVQRATEQPAAVGPGGTRMVPAEGPATAHLPDASARPTDAVTAPATRRPTRGRGFRRWLIAIIVLLLLGTAAAIGGWWLGSGRWATMPVTVGLDRVDAESVVRSAGLIPAVRTAPDDGVRSGLVATSDPQAGTRQLRGSEVSLVVSTGRPKVPQIAPGTSVVEASAAIRQVGLKTAAAAPAEYDDTVPTGTVLRTDPAGGTPLALGSGVTLIRSAGPQPVEIPPVADKSVEDATNALLAAGLQVGPEIKRFDTYHDPGTVLGTDPPAGTSTGRGGTASLVIADSLTVPATSGLDEQAARDLLTGEGFEVTLGDAVYDPAVDGGLVSGTAPAVGTRIDPAAPAITLHLSNSVTVPEVTGRSLDEASEQLRALGLDVTVSAVIGAGFASVIDQSPEAGTRVEPGRQIALGVFP
ncbi:Stk1 family PASTA domain-containing Ser/Thr kinase [Nakamurella sp. YIM 132087]|uniref:non-specific serine/threonine protein kinase n=1 Tax=Nakamurella alba TaxID=2665158 RepID=A0A7K1FT91_9ACTN|nr:Stk1 family PASTA domain-containing Ser/Thr kinase [Nakamurella alba]MTD17376.1 Stk1 family PASTA domain-containing Ser/Thr kinase [Nakamurella alba]